MPIELHLDPETHLSQGQVVMQPLLTIAIPTFNRAAHLEALLHMLRPQVAGIPEIEVLVADNASPDHSPAVIARAAEEFRRSGATLHTHRHSTNIGSDANFAFCFTQAAGRFFWMCGDDDLIMPHAVAEVLALLRNPDGQPADLDMIYATSYAFREDSHAERTGDPLGRQVHTIAARMENFSA